ncbi:MAG TPA: RluA family pseudouridine synthase [Vicinamibacterales bacterium]|jgi:23S rRNA pseudouridine1911/1915/1917 synthase|nr:RluA family pseudouridine synthase [Vicinamibacterales bacterium]
MSPRKAGVAAPGEYWTVAGADTDVRLDKFLAAADRLASRGRAFTALERGKVFVNGVEAVKTDAARRLAAGDVVRVWMDRPGSSKPATSSGKIRDLHIIYEDDALIVVNKPAGLLAVPLERRADAPSVYDQIEAHFRSRGKRRPFVVHRIDRDTSGLVMFAKNGAAQERLKQQFKRREPERVYLAVVYGEPAPAEGTWHDTLVWDRRALIQKETHPDDPRGKEAIADYRVLESFADASLIEVRLRTGKRNQIRLQARLRGHTLVGEERYVFGPETLRPIAFGRQALHAARLELRHPDDGRPLEFEAPLPADFVDLIDRLRRLR